MSIQTGLAESEEQAELRVMVRRLMREASPLALLREEPEFDRGLWKQLSSELGLIGLAVPEQYGGLGQTVVETSVVFEEMGRGLYGGPYLAEVGLAIPALLLSDDSVACQEHLPEIVSGEKVATVAVAESDGSWDTSKTATEASESGDTWRLTGEKSFVLAGADADLLLVTARHGAEVSLFAVRAVDDGVRVARCEALDLARPIASVSLDAAPARLVGTPGAAAEVMTQVLDVGLVGLASEQAGGAGACLDMSVDYAKTREQFGRVIGSFQAVAHSCVEMLQRVEFSRSSARYAAVAIAEGDIEASVAARVAAAYCGKAFREVAVETVHLHGGIGFTWEHDAHLYYRRAFSAEHLFGRTDDHYLAVSSRIGL